MTTINVTRKRGDTRRMIYTIYDQDENVLDITTGYSFLLTADPSKTPTDATNNIFQLTGSILDGPNGRVMFPITAEQADQTPAVYYYDVQMTDPNGELFTVIDGRFKIVQDITKD